MASSHSLSLQYRVNFPFELRGGGSGLALGLSGVISSTASPAQAAAMVSGESISICNDGSFCLWFVIGDPSVSATLAGTPVLPGTKEVFSVPADGGRYTHISTITRSGTTTATLNYGFGS